MKHLIHWPMGQEFDPRTRFGMIQKQMNEIFDFFQNQSSFEEPGTTGIPVDLMENENEFEIHAELPGFSTEEIEINLDQNILSLKAKREKICSDNLYRQERRCGVFERTLSLPSNIDPESITAVSKNGVLMIKIPKRPSQESCRKIEIKSA